MAREGVLSKTRRSRLLASALIGGLALTMSGCANFFDLETLDIQPQVSREGDRLQVEPLLRIAHTTRAQGDLVTAAGLYRRAHELAPKLTEPLLFLGFTLNQAGATAQAADAFRRVLAIDSRNAEALRGLGLAMLHREEPELALERFRAALEIEEDVRLYNAMGVAYDMMGDHHGAHTLYYVGLDVDPENLSIRSNLGLSLALAGYYGDAVTMLDQVARSPMATAEHRKTLALAYGLAGDTDMAARTGRIDMDEAAVAESLRYYEAVREIRQAPAAGS